MMALIFVVVLIWFFMEWRANHKEGQKLSKKGKGLLAASILTFLIAGLSGVSNTDKLYGLFSVSFFVFIVWFFIEWRSNRKEGQKLSKKGKWLLAVALLSFFIGAASSPDVSNDLSEQNQHKTKKVSKSSSKDKSKSDKDSKKSSDKKSSDGKSKNNADGHVEASGVLAFTGKKQHVMGNLDGLGRATYSHIQLQNRDTPTKKRASRLTFNPVGWHNFKFYYGDGSKQAWLMNRGHLIGYQFSGLNDEPKNLVPETAWMNAGNYRGMNDGNPGSMLYYENRLDSWIANHPNYWLDYKVTPIYQGDELIPRQVELAYVGLDSDGKPLEIHVGSDRENIDASGVTHVVLDNVSPNADIDYATGRATNTVGSESQQVAEQKAAEAEAAKSRKSAAQQRQAAAPVENTGSTRTVFVTGGGKSSVYWYDTASMPKRTKMNEVITMTEADAQAQGKRLSYKQG